MKFPMTRPQSPLLFPKATQALLAESADWRSGALLLIRSFHLLSSQEKLLVCKTVLLWTQITGGKGGGFGGTSQYRASF